MEMKRHPIVNGDLSGIPKYEHFLFTIDDELGVKSYVVCGEVRGIIEDLFVFGGGCCYEAEDVKAWMELPEPFTPNDCNMCAYWKEWTDEFGAGNAECALHKNVPFTKIKLRECPLKSRN